MRRRQRYTLQGFGWGAGLTALADIGLQWLEHKQRDEAFTWKSYDGKRTMINATCGGTVGGGIGEILYQLERDREYKRPFYSDEYLRKVLMSKRLSSDKGLVKKIERYRAKLKEWLLSEFSEHLAAPPEDSGSYYKRTALASNFDLDIIVPFKRTAHSTLKEMFNDMYESIARKFGRKAEVIKQTRAVGLCFTDGPDEICIDIVPGREINNYKKDKLLNLYVRPEFFWQQGSSFKTDIKAQQFIPVRIPHVRPVIMLLKLYRDIYCSDLLTIHIDIAATEAINRNGYGINRSLTENLLNAMDLLAQKLNQEAVWDKANSNNNLNDRISMSTRSEISGLLQRDIERIVDDPRYLKEIFEL
ncbi:MAG: hypothetical protein ABI480_01790 [Chitinophagaceae bacterium]